MCSWIEDNCVMGEGDYLGQAARLRPWQRRFIYRLYEFYPETGLRRYKRALLGMAKGNGKSPLAAFIGAYELMGEVNLAPRVIIGASSLKQANLVFADLRMAIEKSPTLAPHADCFDLEIELRDEVGVAERIAAEAGSNDGARATAFIADELHEWLGRTGRVFMVVDGAVTKRRNGFTLAISTAGVRGPRDDTNEPTEPLERQYEYGIALAKGDGVDDETLFEWYEAERDLDLADPEQWLTAVRQANPAAGDFNSIEGIRSRYDGAQRIPLFEFERYHLNRWTDAYTQWLAEGEWDAGALPVHIEPGRAVSVGVKGMAGRKADAVYLAQCGDAGEIHVLGQEFLPDREGEIVDPEDVEEHLRELDRNYPGSRFLYDPHLDHRRAQTLLEEGLDMVAIPQTPQHKMQFSQALYDAVVHHRLHHGGDTTLAKQAKAAVAKQRGSAWILVDGPVPIPAVIAAAMAVDDAGAEEDTDSGFIPGDDSEDQDDELEESEGDEDDELDDGSAEDEIV